MTAGKWALIDLVPLVRAPYEQSCRELDNVCNTSLEHATRFQAERMQAKTRLRRRYDAIMDRLLSVQVEI